MVEAVPNANKVGRILCVIEALISNGSVLNSPANNVVLANSS
ncbi:uncharacterized protein METZ01_LOCUS77525 [marine metagenome]|uniref:Uncharacterized protein n=1 Tax=marine metagenome TaxID=408172 RepID=A0A381UA99_9ZZZZ